MSGPDPPQLVFDDFTLDLAGGRLLREGRPQPLHPDAFAVLCLLVRSPGQVFSPAEILEEVWGRRPVSPARLGAVMARLREALGDDAQHPRYLCLVPGYGYRFDRPATISTRAH